MTTPSDDEIDWWKLMQATVLTARIGAIELILGTLLLMFYGLLRLGYLAAIYLKYLLTGRR